MTSRHNRYRNQPQNSSLVKAIGRMLRHQQTLVLFFATFSRRELLHPQNALERISGIFLQPAEQAAREIG
jgi:hypothetical protein